MNITDTIRELVTLENNYGWLSCIDYPQQYDMMDKLYNDLHKQGLTSDLIDLYKLTLSDMRHLEDDEFTLTHYTREEMIDLVTDEWDELAVTCLHWLAEYERIRLIEVNDMIPFEHHWSDKHSQYFVVANTY